jgi:hypothetical protein
MKKVLPFLFAVVALLAASCSPGFNGRWDDRRRDDSRNGRWQLLGEQEVDDRTDRDRIDVRRDDGPFRELRIEVRDAPIEIRDMVVTFADGEKFQPRISERYDEGQRSRVISLPGGRRSVDGVEFLYRSIDRRGGKGKVLLYGR